MTSSWFCYLPDLTMHGHSNIKGEISVFDLFDRAALQFETFQTERNSVTGRANKEAFTPGEDKMWDVLCS